MQTHSHRTPPPRLPEDSLGYALLTAAELVAEVGDGRTLTDALAALWAARPATPSGVRGAILDLAYGTLRDFGRQDFILGRLLEKPLQEPVRSLLRVALHRLGTRPDSAHTTVDQAVSAAATVLGGNFKGVVNGVLRNALRQTVELNKAADADMVAEYRHPPWWIRRLKSQYPQDWRAILGAGHDVPRNAGADNIHLSDIGQKEVGRRMGLLYADRVLKLPGIDGLGPRLVSVTSTDATHTKVKFSQTIAAAKAGETNYSDGTDSLFRVYDAGVEKSVTTVAIDGADATALIITHASCSGVRVVS